MRNIFSRKKKKSSRTSFTDRKNAVRKTKVDADKQRLDELLKVKGKMAIHLTSTDIPKNRKEKGIMAGFVKAMRWLFYTGKKKIVILLIPHNGKNILSIPIRMFVLWFFGICLSSFIFYSIIQIIDRSGKDVEFYDLGITDEEFDGQIVRMADRMLPMHEVINNYYETLLSIVRKMDLGQDRGHSHDALVLADTLSAEQIQNFKDKLEACRTEEEFACNREQSEDILQQLIFLTEIDNEKMRKSIQFFDQILTQLNAEEKKNLFDSIPNVWPVQGYLLRSYGDQFDERLGIRIFKRGIEIGAVAGASVQATAPGIVDQISYDSTLGLNVLIRHGYGVSTLYAHLDGVSVSPNEELTRGQKIGNVGFPNTYRISALYYEVHIGAVAYDPLAFLNHPEAVWLNNSKN